MKCPYCHIHYMDDERECPMCGTRNLNYKIGFGSKKQAVQDKPVRQSAKQSAVHAPTPSKKTKKTQNGEKKKIEWGKIFAVLLVFVPLLGDIVFDLIDNTQESIEVINLNLLEPPESALLTLDGEWECEETGEVLTFSVETLEYTLVSPEQEEHGQMEIIEDSVEEDEDGLELYLYRVNFYPDDTYEYTYTVAGAPYSQLMVMMPVDEVEANMENMQSWERKENTAT